MCDAEGGAICRCRSESPRSSCRWTRESGGESRSLRQYHRPAYRMIHVRLRGLMQPPSRARRSARGKPPCGPSMGARRSVHQPRRSACVPIRAASAPGNGIGLWRSSHQRVRELVRVEQRVVRVEERDPAVRPRGVSIASAGSATHEGKAERSRTKARGGGIYRSPFLRAPHCPGNINRSGRRTLLARSCLIIACMAPTRLLIDVFAKSLSCLQPSIPRHVVGQPPT
jgi:hypothetical protein